MRHLAPAALLIACACASAPAGPAPSTADRRHHVVVTSDAIVLDFVDAHGTETIDVLVVNMTRNTNVSQAPIDLSPLARLKSVHTLSLSGFTVWQEPQGLQTGPLSLVTPAPGFTDRQVEDIGGIRTLRRLDLRGCSLSGSQRTRLKALLPQCEVREN